MRRRPIIAIDGPAGSGKSTTARAVAEHLGYVHLDSGAVYRAVTLVALGKLGPADSWTEGAVIGAAKQQGVVIRTDGGFDVLVGGHAAGDALRTQAVTREVSRVAAMPAVRDYVNGLLREVAQDGGIVMDGRDIGTVVFPDAEVKVFLVAESEERARRRLLETGRSSSPEAVRLEAGALEARDRHDSRREVAPLARAEDAVVIDTTRLSFEEQVRLVVQRVQRASARSP